MKTIKNLVIVLIVCSAITVTAIGVADNRNQATSSDQSIQSNASSISDQTVDQIIAQKKLNDKPKPKIDRKGKVEKNLYDNITNALPTDKFRVAIWVKDDGIVQIPKTAGKDNFDSNIAKINKDIAAKQKSVKDHLNSKNLKILYASTFAPVVFAELTKSDIQDIEAKADVTLIQSETIYQPLIYSSVPSVLAPPVWNFVPGGTTVAVIESDGIAFANPNLKTGTYYNSANPNIESHATGVAGIIASTNPTYSGVAWKGPALLSANSQTFADSDLMAATDWAMANGAHVLSNSWGYPGDIFTAMSYYEDYIVTRYPYPTVVFAAGNSALWASSQDKLVNAPARSYNVISVGSYDDKGTGYAWEDDVMSTYSSYGAISPHGDRELPEVSAVGCHDSTASWGITSTTTSSPWIGNIGCGTSYAAPEVSGEASLLINAQPALWDWPEAIRAIIIASTDHNIQDNNIARLNNKMLRPPAGNGINILEAYKIVNNGLGVGYTYGSLGYSSGSPWYGPNIYANQGQKVRVIFTWDSDSSGYSGTDIMHEDLDLFIQRWDGASWVSESRAGASASWDNNYEIVEFNAPVSGTYRAQVNKYRWDDPSSITYYGYAAYVK